MHRTRVGDRYVVERMRADGLNLGGEQSGHIILSDFSTTGDGLVAALQVLATLVEARMQTPGCPASVACHVFDPLPQLLQNVRFTGPSPLGHPVIIAAVAEAEATLAATGRLLLRESGTEPLVRVMAEGADEDLVRRVVQGLCAEIEAVTRLQAA